MGDVYLIGAGETPVTKGSAVRPRQLAAEAVEAAIAQAGIERSEIGMLLVGNMMSGMLARQQQLGALIADLCGLRGIEAASVESACSSGAAAARWGYTSVAGGLHDVVVVCGVEVMTSAPWEDTTAALATAADWEIEGRAGETFISLNARLMRLYMDTYGIDHGDFAHFAVNAHHNASTNPSALLRKPIDRETYLGSRVLADPVKLLDAPPVCDGAAAVVLATEAVARAAGRSDLPSVRIAGSAIGTDSLALAERADPLWLSGVELSTGRALEQAGVQPADIDLFELHDAYTIITSLSLEAAGFVPRGRGVHFGECGEIALDGALPISTMGGLKARGHPVGATGVYQLAEIHRQLTGTAGPNQVPGAELALVQNIGGTGATVVSHVLQRV